LEDGGPLQTPGVRSESHKLVRVMFKHQKHIDKDYITDYKLASEGFTICTYTTSLTFDLTSDQEKLQRNRKKTLSGKIKGRNLQESNRGGPLFRMDRSSIYLPS